jgi:hypothetical protein
MVIIFRRWWLSIHLLRVAARRVMMVNRLLGFILHPWSRLLFIISTTIVVATTTSIVVPSRYLIIFWLVLTPNHDNVSRGAWVVRWRLSSWQFFLSSLSFRRVVGSLMVAHISVTVVVGWRSIVLLIPWVSVVLTLMLLLILITTSHLLILATATIIVLQVVTPHSLLLLWVVNRHSMSIVATTSASAPWSWLLNHPWARHWRCCTLFTALTMISLLSVAVVIRASPGRLLLSGRLLIIVIYISGRSSVLLIIARGVARSMLVVVVVVIYSWVATDAFRMRLLFKFRLPHMLILWLGVVVVIFVFVHLVVEVAGQVRQIHFFEGVFLEQRL